MSADDNEAVVVTEAEPKAVVVYTGEEGAPGAPREGMTLIEAAVVLIIVGFCMFINVGISLLTMLTRSVRAHSHVLSHYTLLHTLSHLLSIHSLAHPLAPPLTHLLVSRVDLRRHK